jgi:hypothetical protein
MKRFSGRMRTAIVITIFWFVGLLFGFAVGKASMLVEPIM